jgi:lipopolysaccharide export system ATP-binding protein
VKKRKAVKKVVKKVSVVDSVAHPAPEVPFFIDDSLGLQTGGDHIADRQPNPRTTYQAVAASQEAEPLSAGLEQNGAEVSPTLAPAVQEPARQGFEPPALTPRNTALPVAFAATNGKALAGADESVLGADGLRKSYRKRTVVHNVSLEIRQSEIVGLLGPNGAGKTTIFYMIVGLEKPDKGKIYLDAKDISRLPMYLRARNGISYLPQEASVFRKLTVEENILLVLQTMPLTKREREHRLESLLDELDIEYVRHTKAYQLSGGERRRTEIARCLVIEPRFILLDEPFAGIDPIAVIDIQKILQKLRERGIGVLITDHNVRETLAITDRAYIINEGQIFRAGTPDALTQDEEVRRVYLGENFRM